MKLYLLSYRLGDSSEKLAELFSTNKKIAVIANSMDFVSENDRKNSVLQEINDLSSLGLSPEEMDCGFDKILKEKVKEQDFVYSGYSAGICVLSKTLRGLDIVDNPKIAPQVKTLRDGEVLIIQE